MIGLLDSVQNLYMDKQADTSLKFHHRYQHKPLIHLEKPLLVGLCLLAPDFFSQNRAIPFPSFSWQLIFADLSKAPSMKSSHRNLFDVLRP